jgi:DNA invertase Pin-like site-specific DNA recombinase
MRRSANPRFGRHKGQPGAAEDQVRLARTCGWPEHSSEVIEDIGSGTRSDRTGYQRLLALIGGGSVGAIFVSNASRVTRKVDEWHDFVERCRSHGVRVVVGGIEYDTDHRPLRPDGTFNREDA